MRTGVVLLVVIMRCLCVYVVCLLLGTSASADWPQFRGPDGQGHAHAVDAPIRWSETESIRWKTPLPGLGWSSPVVVDDEVWLTTATDEGRSLRALCVDRQRGKLLRNVEVFTRSAVEKVHSQNSYASPTPVVDGEHVFVHFGPAGTACLTRSGDIVWQTERFRYQTPHGSASSPVVYGRLLLICCDGSDKQFVAAIDKRSGETVWRRERAHMEDAHRKSKAENDENRKGLPFIAFSTPLIVEVQGQPLLISTPADHVVANRVNDGREVWWHPYNCFSLVARPVSGHGLAYAIGGIRDGHYKMFAIPLDASGELKESQLAWTRDISVPQVPSPILVGERLFLINDKGVATCLDAKNGVEVWRARLGGNYRASPIAIGDHVYCLAQNGKTTVFQAAGSYQPIATNQLDGVFLASPAVDGQSIFLRSDRHLYRIE